MWKPAIVLMPPQLAVDPFLAQLSIIEDSKITSGSGLMTRPMGNRVKREARWNVFHHFSLSSRKQKVCLFWESMEKDESESNKVG